MFRLYVGLMVYKGPSNNNFLHLHSWYAKSSSLGLIHNISNFTKKRLIVKKHKRKRTFFLSYFFRKNINRVDVD